MLVKANAAEQRKMVRIALPGINFITGGNSKILAPYTGCRPEFQKRNVLRCKKMVYAFPASVIIIRTGLF